MADGTTESSSGYSSCGCCGGYFSVGGIIAAIMSWTTWHSVGWLIVNAFFGWAYVIYWLIYYR